MDLVATFAAIDYSELTDGLVAAFEGGVSLILPVLAVIIAAFLVIKTIKRFAK